MAQFHISGGKKQKAPRVVLYGVEGIGKSTFASQFPRPLFIDTEGSTAYLDVERFDPAPTSWQELLDMVAYAKGADCSTLVVDTLDWAERLCIDAVLGEQKWASIESPGYGRGYKYVYEKFAKLLDALTEVADSGKTVVCTAHAKMVKFEQPDEAGAYDRWGLKLIDTRNTSVASMVKEWADAVLFANYKTIVEHTSDGKAKARGAKRVMFTAHDATFDAKNRWGLAPEVPFEFSSIAAHIPATQPQDGAAGAQDRVSRPIQPAADPTPAQAPETPQGAAQAASPVQPASLYKLRSLMAAWGITDGEMQLAVAAQGYVTSTMPLESYRPELLDYLVAQFDAVRGFIEQTREAPFV